MIKTSFSTFTAFTAIALVMASPTIALAKNVAQPLKHSTVQPLINHGPAPLPPVTVYTTGEIISESNGKSVNGLGKWTKGVTKEGGGITKVAEVITYGDGVTIVKTETIDKISPGVVSYDTTTTTKNGSKTTTITSDVTDTKESNGTVGISDVVTNARGKQVDITGTETTGKTILGTPDHTIVLHENGKTEDVTTATASYDGYTATVTTGTGFNGKAINNETLIYNSGTGVE